MCRLLSLFLFISMFILSLSSFAEETNKLKSKTGPTDELECESIAENPAEVDNIEGEALKGGEVKVVAEGDKKVSGEEVDQDTEPAP